MFDLFRSRAKAVRYLLGGLLLLVALSMVVTLIPGYGTGGGGNDPVVAEVGKETLTLREVQLRVQTAIRNGNIPREMIAIYVPQFVDQMILDRALHYEAARLGFEVTENDLANALRSSLPQLFPGGQFAGKEAYAAFLAQQNLTIPEFEAEYRKQMLLTKLRNIALSGVVVTPAEIEQEYRRRNEKVKLDYFALTPDKYKSQVSVSDAEMAGYFGRHRAAFQVPEKRSYQMLIVDEAKVAAGIVVSDLELRRVYDANKEQYRLPERVHVRHILLKTTQQPAQEVAKIEARAEGLLKQIRGGADFAELAKKNSEDPGTATKGGDLDWVARGQTVEAFEKTAFSLKPKEISNVVKTEYGFHILQVLAKEEPRVKPFEEVKNQLAQDRKKQQVFDSMQRLADQAREELTKHPQQAAEIAQRLGVQLTTVDKAAASDPRSGASSSREMQEAVQSLQRGGVTPVVQIEPGKLAVAVLTDILPGRPAEMAEVASQIRETLLAQNVAQLVDQKAREAAAKAKSGDFKAVAKSMGLEVKSTQEFGRDGAADGIGSAIQVAEAFNLSPGGVFGPVPVTGSQFVCRVASKTQADPARLAAQRASIFSALKTKKARERNDLFEDSIITRLIMQGKVKRHEDVIRRFVTSFRG